MQTCAKWKATEQHNKESSKSRKEAKRNGKLGKQTREQHEEACALLGSAGLEATEPVRKQHSRGFVLPGWPAVELLKYKVRPETNHQVNQWKGTAYVQLTIE